MHRFTDFQPQLADSTYGPEPSLLDIIERYYIAQHVEWDRQELANPRAAAQAYIDAWLALERAEFNARIAATNLVLSESAKVEEDAKVEQHKELQRILWQFDSIAAMWGDESQFNQCRSRLRHFIEHHA